MALTATPFDIAFSSLRDEIAAQGERVVQGAQSGRSTSANAQAAAAPSVGSQPAESV